MCLGEAHCESEYQRRRRNCGQRVPDLQGDADHHLAGSHGISESRRELELSFDGERITLARPDAAVSDAGHDVRAFRFYDGQRLCTTIRADFTARTVSTGNHVDAPVKTAFGNNPHPPWANFQAFLE